MPNFFFHGKKKKTHIKKTINIFQTLKKNKRHGSKHFFAKDTGSALSDYIKQTTSSCFICDRIKTTFKRYLVTTLYLYEKDSDFRKKFKNSKGFCLEHYGMLYDLAPSHLSGQVLVDFTSNLNEIFLTNFKRVQEDVSWFVDKHDYRNKEASWKNSKDSLPRAMTKVNSILSEN